MTNHAVEMYREAVRLSAQSDMFADAQRDALAAAELAVEVVEDDMGSDAEPFRSIVFLLAINLALDMDRYELGRKLISKAMLGLPSPDDEEEFRYLSNQIEVILNRRKKDAK